MSKARNARELLRAKRGFGPGRFFGLCQISSLLAKQEMQKANDREKSEDKPLVYMTPKNDLIRIKLHYCVYFHTCFGFTRPRTTISTSTQLLRRCTPG